jgi:predicted aspartyl protease
MEKLTTKLAAAALGLLLAQLAAAEEVDFRFAQKRFVIVPVVVDGQGPYDFLLDTGSTTSVVDQKLAKELGLKPLQKTVIRTASGTERVPIARIHEMRVGSRSAQTVLVLVSKMDGVRKLDKSIRGILGFNFLSRFRYTLDYRHQRLRFDSGAVAGARVPFDASGRSIVLAAGESRLLLDTGATGVFLFRAEGLDVAVNARAVARVTTNAGRRISKSGWLERLDIGGVSLAHVPVTLMPETGLERHADGLLPGTLFDAIYFDHENGFVVLNPEERNEQASIRP